MGENADEFGQRWPSVVPPPPEREILRDNVLDVIEKTFGGSAEALFVTGERGLGKTTLLAQYVRRHPYHCIPLFLSPHDRPEQAPHLLRAITGHQVARLLGIPPPPNGQVDEPLLRRYLTSLQKRALRRGERFYFVFDGLGQTPFSDSRSRGAILDVVLPIPSRSFRYLFSGETEALRDVLPWPVVYKDYPLTSLSKDEARSFLHGLPIEPPQMETLLRVCSGHPGKLTSVRRLMRRGIECGNILQANPSTLSDFVRLEWEHGMEGREGLRDMLAVLANCRHPCTVADLAHICGVLGEPSASRLTDTGLVTIAEGSGYVDFLSDAHRQYASEMLADLRDTACSKIIDSLLSGTQTEKCAAVYLPTYYLQAGRDSELVETITNDYLSSVMADTESLVPVHRNVELGMDAACRLGNTATQLRFGLTKAVVSQLDGIDVWKSEVEARMATGQTEAAMALAQSAATKEDRLHLLALVGRLQCEDGLDPSPELVEQIRFLFDQVDAAKFGERTPHLVAELLAVEPELALAIVDQGHLEIDDESALDWAESAMPSGRGQKRDAAIAQLGTLERAFSRSKDPRVLILSDAARVLLGKCTAAEAIRAVDRLRPEHRLLFLRNWTVAHAQGEGGDSIQVINYAIDELVRTTSYTPKTRDLADLAAPLPTLEDPRETLCLVERFDALMEVVRHRGASRDYVSLQLLLAKAEERLDPERAWDRLATLFCEIDDIEDWVTRAECWSLMYGSLDDFRPPRNAKTKESITSDSRAEWQQSIDRVLADSADQERNTAGVIEALAATRPRDALELVALKLNSEVRRDRALLSLVRLLTHAPLSAERLKTACEATPHIKDSRAKDLALLEALRQLATAAQVQQVALPEEVLQLVARADEISAQQWRCEACALSLALLTYMPLCKSDDLAGRLENAALDSWKRIHSDWDKVDMGFRLAKILAATHPQLAASYFAKAEETKKGTVIHADASARTYLMLLRLAMRAYRGLVATSSYRAEDTERLSGLIDQVPSLLYRVYLWSEAATRCLQADRLDEASRIVTTYLKPSLDRLKELDQYAWTEAVPLAAPALFRHHQPTAMQMIELLSRQQQDEAYASICAFLVQKMPPGEPFRSLPKESPEVSFENLNDICNLVPHIQTDHLVYGCVQAIADALSAKRSAIYYTDEQCADLLRRLRLIVETRLPDGINIKHDGYKVLGASEVARIAQRPRQRGHQGRRQTWLDLLARARQIQNLSDRVFVLAMLGGTMYSSEDDIRRQCFEEAAREVAKVGSISDRVDRLLVLAQMCYTADRGKAKELIRCAMKTSALEANADTMLEQHRSILDYAHRVDPSLADELATVFDSDPARQRERRALQREAQLLRLKDAMSRGTEPPPDEHASNERIARAAWLNLGALNGGATQPIRVESVAPYVALASKMPLQTAYPVLAWALETYVRRALETGAAASLVPRLFEACALTSEFALRVATRTSTSWLSGGMQDAQRTSDDDHITVKKGERGRALAFIREWFAAEGGDYLIICDPHFDMDGLGVVEMLSRENPSCAFRVLTGPGELKDAEKPIQEAFRDYWTQHISAAPPPDIQVLIVETDSPERTPLHDRWLITSGSGIQLGTSLNGLGKRLSRIDRMEPREAQRVENELNAYLERRQQFAGNDRIRYLGFNF